MQISFLLFHMVETLWPLVSVRDFFPLELHVVICGMNTKHVFFHIYTEHLASFQVLSQ